MHDITTIVIDSRLLWTAQIEAADGEVHDYTIRRIRPGLDEFALEFHRQDSGETYRTAVDAAGAVRCNCPDYIYRRSKKDARSKERGCKHSIALRRIKAVLEALKEVPA